MRKALTRRSVESSCSRCVAGAGDQTDYTKIRECVHSSHFSYVDDPLLARCLQCFDQIACVHMFGLLVRSHMNAGQDGFRDTGSKHYGGRNRRPVALSECPASWIDRSHHLLVVLQGLASAQHGCSSGAPRVWPISRPRRPWRQARVSRRKPLPSASASTRCAPSCWPAPQRPASATCA